MRILLNKKEKRPYLEQCRAIRDAISESRLDVTLMREHLEPSIRVDLWGHLYDQLYEELHEL